MFQLDKILSKTNLKYVIAILWGFFFFWEALWALHDMITLSTYFIYLDDSELFHTSILQFSKWAYNDMTYKIIKKNMSQFFGSFASQIQLNLCREPPLWGSIALLFTTFQEPTTFRDRESSDYGEDRVIYSWHPLLSVGSRDWQASCMHLWCMYACVN